MPRGYAVVGCQIAPNVPAAFSQIAAAGCTHAIILCYWTLLQPNGPGTAFDTTQVAVLNQNCLDARAAGLKIILEHSVYPPDWILADVEAFRDQAGNNYIDTTPGSGKQVRNWFWTANGRAYFADFIAKVYPALTPDNRAAVDRIRFAGGYFGELQYPPVSLTTPYSYWGFGSSMQTGTGLAAGLSVCPLPGYTPFTGTDAQDVTWLNWYLDGLDSWILFYSSNLKAAGWTCMLHCLHPGYSVRANNTRGQLAYQQSIAAGHDWTRQIGVYKNDPQVWPWSTWINGYDGYVPNTYDTDQASFKKLYAEAYARGKHYRIWGENSGGEDDSGSTGMGSIFVNALAGAAGPSTGGPLYPSSPLYPSGPSPKPAYTGYIGMMWLNYQSLTGGASGAATLADYAAHIAANP